MSEESFDEIAKDLEKLLEKNNQTNEEDHFDYEKLYEKDSSDFEYLGACSSVKEVIDILEWGDEKDSDSIIIVEEITLEKSSEELEDGELESEELKSSESESSESESRDSESIGSEFENYGENNIVTLKRSYYLRKRKPIQKKIKQNEKKRKTERPLYDIEYILKTEGSGKNKRHFVKFVGYSDEEWVWDRDMVDVGETGRFANV